MSTAESDQSYCVDTSAFIDLRVRYPKEVFPGVWNRVSELAKVRRLISPAAVQRELKGKADEVLQWARQRRRLFVRLDGTQQRIVRELLQRFPDFVDPNKLVPEADPFVIALALARNRQEGLLPAQWAVVTQEKLSRSGRPKIPNVCAAFSVPCIDVLEMFRREKWRF
jgi:Domain of unknown function (DUF4411)